MNNGAVANVGLNKFYSKIYAFLAMGIGVSALVSYLILNVFPMVLVTLLNSTALFFGLWIVQIGLVLFLGVRAQKNPSLAVGGFLVYSVLNGVTISATLLLYAQATVVSAFVSAAATFGAMSLVGMFTKKDLSAMGHAAYSALIGIIIAMVINFFFLRSSAVSFFISILMVLIFAGITAYDNQRIRQVYNETGGQAGTGIAVFFALQLYLDFINLFLAFLRIFGKNN
ncbi:Bax inhibitor-1/YccA family protein [Enterococcus plantarum]|uniref:BAX inhibitor (BI)-1/YccA family protein n=1 Tax=Enterococcus plantarum TaxID=1077675 RepID=A0A2W3Z545_9ENTE|nr:Bax inhibitor-1/YccA family protein [Enterococcus plantarum]MBO0467618.1 Bax inhibitor-1/YccA family protein [Enterococcus plantarum]PZL75248.1 BAX inhibitor (BI)-1/YccA family protein [Enterococcus plantarum]